LQNFSFFKVCHHNHSLISLIIVLKVPLSPGQTMLRCHRKWLGREGSMCRVLQWHSTYPLTVNAFPRALFIVLLLLLFVNMWRNVFGVCVR